MEIIKIKKEKRNEGMDWINCDAKAIAWNIFCWIQSWNIMIKSWGKKEKMGWKFFIKLCIKGKKIES